MTADLHPDTGLPRPGTCCGVCPPIADGGWDCTCEGNIRCQTAADRPSVTDNARAEAMRLWPGAPPGVLTKHQVQLDMARRRGFIHGAEWAAGRAETTTATAEDITEALYEATQDPNDIEVPAVARRLHGLLSARGLLATARTRPTETEWTVIGKDDTPDEDEWIASLDEYTREEAERYRKRFGGSLASREVTAWTEADR